MNNHMGLFGWIREGVKQSVLLGVSDAMDVLGVPGEAEALHPSIPSGQATDAIANKSGARRGPQKQSDTTQDSTGASGAIAPRKRLGKSLKDLSPAIVPKGSAAAAPKQ